MTDSTRHLLRPRTFLATLVGSAAALVAALGIPSAADAVTLGSTHIARSSQAGLFCGGFPNCAYSQTSLPDGTVRAHFDGRIRSWKVNLETPGSLQLLVLKQQGDRTFKAVEASSVRTTTTKGVNRFGANLRIRKGDLVGLNLLDEDITLQVLQPGGDLRERGFKSAFDIGGTLQPYRFFSSTFNELQFNATLKH